MEEYELPMATATDTVTEDRSVAFKQSQRFIFYHIIVALIGLLSVFLVGAEALTKPDDKMHQLIQFFDVAICVLLLMDFIGSFIAAPNRWKYFFTWGWLDLISSIPALPLARIGRMVQVVRVIRLIRAFKTTRLITSLVFSKRGENTLLGVLLVAIILVVTCSAFVLHFERNSGGNIRTAQDALWWSVATITKSGFGDHYPITNEGRFVAVVMMVSGLGLLGLFSGYVATWIMGAEPDATKADIKGLEERLDRIEQMLDEIRNKS